jgi:RHS repeat-associated protein
MSTPIYSGPPLYEKVKEKSHSPQSEDKYIIKKYGVKSIHHLSFHPELKILSGKLNEHIVQNDEFNPSKKSTIVKSFKVEHIEDEQFLIYPQEITQKNEVNTATSNETHEKTIRRSFQLQNGLPLLNSSSIKFESDPRIIFTKKTYKTIEDEYLNVLSNETISNQEDEIKNSLTLGHNELGEVISYQSDLTNLQYERNQDGQIERVSKQGNLLNTISYLKETPLVIKKIEDGEEVVFSHDPLSGELQSQKRNHQNRFFYQYTIDEILKEIKDEEGTVHYLLKMPDIVKKDHQLLLKKDLHQTIKGIEYISYVDGMGRIIKKDQLIQEGKRNLFLKEYSPRGLLLKEFDHKDSNLTKTQFEYDYLGREVKAFIQSHDSSQSHVFTNDYSLSCIEKFRDGTFLKKHCYNEWGDIASYVDPYEEVSFSHQSFGRNFEVNYKDTSLSRSIMRIPGKDGQALNFVIPNHNARYFFNFNKKNNLVSSSLQGLKESSQSFSDDDLKVTNHAGIEKTYDIFGKLQESSAQGEIIQKYEYKNKRLVKETLFFDQKKQVKVFSYEEKTGFLSSIRIGDYLEQFTYDKFGTTKIFKNSNTDLEYIYKDGQLISIIPIVEEIIYNQDGKIEEVKYQNGLNLTQGFDHWGRLLNRSYAHGENAHWSMENEYNNDNKILKQIIQGSLTKREEKSYTYFGNGISLDFFPNLNNQSIVRNDKGVLVNETVSMMKRETPEEKGDDQEKARQVLLDLQEKMGLTRKRKREVLNLSLNSHNMQKWSTTEDPIRNYQGEVKNIDGTFFSWKNFNPVKIKTKNDEIKQFFNDQGELVRSCLGNNCLEKLTPNTYHVHGHVIHLLSIEGLALGVFIDQGFYPITTDHLGSVRGIFNPRGDELLFERKYKEFGEKKVIKSKSLTREEKSIEKLIIWSFAQLKQLPFDIDGQDLYFSRSRFYSAELKEWLSVDPLIKTRPKNMINLPGNWNPVRYAGNDPVNFVDPSGYASFSVNYSNRNRMNDSFMTKGIKTAASFALGAAYNNAARNSFGLGVGVGELVKNNFRLAALGTVAGSMGATALNMGVKTVLVGAAFTFGQKVGNIFGASIDTLVDNAQGSANDFFSKILNSTGATDVLNDIGFGSGSPNFDFQSSGNNNTSSSDFWDNNPYSSGN